MKKKILFLGETYRADAQTWINGLQDFGDFNIITWELQTPSNSFVNKVLRIFEYLCCVSKIRKIVQIKKPNIVIAERATSYGFLAALSGCKTIVIAQQGISDLWPENSVLFPLKKIIQNYAFKKATLIHAWGEVMIPAMIAAKVPASKIMMLPKGIDLNKFFPANDFAIKQEKLFAIVTRSLETEYGHQTILKAFAILKSKNIDFQLTIIGDGSQKKFLQQLSKDLQIDKNVFFTGKINNNDLPKFLEQHQFYISMPTTEGVSASLFEAMACKCYPIVSDIPGNAVFIKNNKNGSLTLVGNAEKLAETLIVAYANEPQILSAVHLNYKFVHQNANYATNMKIISEKYHEIIENQ